MDAFNGERDKKGGDIELRDYSSTSASLATDNRYDSSSSSNPNNNRNDKNYNSNLNTNSNSDNDNSNSNNDNNNSSSSSMNNRNGFSNANSNNKYALVVGGNPARIDTPFELSDYNSNGSSNEVEVTGCSPSQDTNHVIMGESGADPGSDDNNDYDGDHHDNNTEGNGSGGRSGQRKNDWTSPVVTTSWKRQWLSTWFIYVVILTPIVMLPIILCVDDSYEKEARCGYVIAIMAVYWTTEVIPISITALLPVVLLPMLGVMTARETSGAFFNDVSMLFVGGLLVAIAIEVWDVHKRIALLTVRTVGAEPKLLLLGITLVTWFLSMWISNTATTAMMMTIVQALLDQYREVFRRRDARKAGRSFDDHNRISTELSVESEREYARLVKSVVLTVAYASNIGGTGSLTGTGPNIIFFGAAQELFESKGIKNPVTFGTWLAYGIPMSFVLVLVQWVWMVVRFLRCRGGWSCCLSKKNMDHNEMDQVNEVIEREYQKLGPVSYAQKTIFVTFFFMVVCWVSRDLGGVGGWGEWFLPKMVSDSTASILFGILMFVLPSRPPRICGKGGWKGNFIQVKPLLNWNLVQQKMPWSLYIVLGGGYSIAKAATVSGLSTWLGDQLLVFKDLNNWVIVLIICYVVTFATEVTSNSATATLMMPILSQMAISLQVNPLLFMYPAAIATSFAFMLPAATPPNAIVFSTGTVRVIDMFSTGLLLNIVSVPILLAATATLGNALFQLDTIPVEFIRNSTVT